MKTKWCGEDRIGSRFSMKVNEPMSEPLQLYEPNRLLQTEAVEQPPFEVAHSLMSSVQNGPVKPTGHELNAQLNHTDYQSLQRKRSLPIKSADSIGTYRTRDTGIRSTLINIRLTVRTAETTLTN